MKGKNKTSNSKIFIYVLVFAVCIGIIYYLLSFRGELNPPLEWKCQKIYKIDKGVDLFCPIYTANYLGEDFLNLNGQVDFFKGSNGWYISGVDYRIGEFGIYYPNDSITGSMLSTRLIGKNKETQKKNMQDIYLKSLLHRKD